MNHVGRQACSLEDIFRLYDKHLGHAIGAYPNTQPGLILGRIEFECTRCGQRGTATKLPGIAHDRRWNVDGRLFKLPCTG